MAGVLAGCAALTGWAVSPYALLLFAPLVLLVLRPLVRSDERWVWGAAAFGAAVSTAAQLGAVSSWDGTPGSVVRALAAHQGLAVLTLAGHPFLYAAQMGLLRRRVTQLLPSAWIDGAHTGVLLAAVCNAVLLEPVRAATGLGTLGAVALVGRPAMDLLLLSVAAATCSILGRRRERRAVLLLAAFAVMTLSDVLGVVHLCGVLDGGLLAPAVAAGHLLALALLAAAAWQRGGDGVARVVVAWSAMVAPLVMLAISAVLLGVDHHHRLPAPTSQLALLGLVGVGVKVGMVFREVLRLAGSRDLALTDELTGLPNRRALAAALARATSDDRPSSLLLFDLDHFKDVNDSHGHAHGDDLLREVARRVPRSLPPGGLPVRLGGDEFAVLLPGSGLVEAERIAADVLDGLARPLDLHSVPTRIHASIGVAGWPFPARQVLPPEHDDAAGELLRRADAAMYVAKRAGGGTARYDENADRAARSRRLLAHELQAGIGAGQLETHYQPQVDVRTGRATGMEALVRWRHAARGLLAPAAFLDLAEQNGLMAGITSTVLHQAAHAAVTWQRPGRPLRVSVNLATECLLNPDLPALVAQVLAATGLDPQLLVLEITETTLMQDPRRSRETIAELLRLGTSVSIDDYGTGYSSLAYLQDLPAAELKLDRAFTQRLGHDTRTASIIKSTTDLAHSLGLRMLVEGVEDAATLARLAELGVDETQGFHHSRPLPAEEVLPWLGRQEPQVASPLRGAERRTPAPST